MLPEPLPPSPLPLPSPALDYTVIFVVGMGVRGAALATVFAQVGAGPPLASMPSGIWPLYPLLPLGVP